MNMKQLIELLQEVRTTEEADLLLYTLEEKKHASWSDIKYITGYLGKDERNRIIKFF